MYYIYTGNWDPSLRALFFLLHLIPPAAQGRGKGIRCNILQARERLVTFHKVKYAKFID